jgi:putative oxidoreductase
MKKLFSTAPLWPGITGVVRIVTGIFMIYHGAEVFDAAIMKDYAARDEFKHFSSPAFMPYLGKSAEFVAGVLLTIGLFTKVGALILIITMAYISFFVGHGIIWYDDIPICIDRFAVPVW